jgi:hypothetical protein
MGARRIKTGLHRIGAMLVAICAILAALQLYDGQDAWAAPLSRLQSEIYWIQFLVVLVVMTILSIIPAVRLLRRVGKSRAWALLALYPGGGVIILLWVIAYSRWEPQANISS